MFSHSVVFTILMLASNVAASNGGDCFCPLDLTGGKCRNRNGSNKEYKRVQVVASSEREGIPACEKLCALEGDVCKGFAFRSDYDGNKGNCYLYDYVPDKASKGKNNKNEDWFCYAKSSEGFDFVLIPSSKPAKLGEVCDGHDETTGRPFPSCEPGMICEYINGLTIPGAGQECVLDDSNNDDKNDVATVYAELDDICEGFDETTGHPFPSCGSGMMCKETAESSIPGAEHTCVLDDIVGGKCRNQIYSGRKLAKKTIADDLEGCKDFCEENGLLCNGFDFDSRRSGVVNCWISPYHPTSVFLSSRKDYTDWFCHDKKCNC